MYNDESMPVLFLLFFLVRIIFLDRLPIFNDEAIGLNKGLVLTAQPELWAQLVGDGKNPGISISLAAAQSLPIDPLLAGRLVSVVSSLLTFIAILRVAHILDISQDSKRFLAVFLAFCPYLLFYDRLALPAAPVTAAASIALALTLSFCQRPRIVTGALLGLTIAIGWWFFSLILIILPAIGLTLLISYRQLFANRKETTLGIVAGVCIFILLTLPVWTNPSYQAVNRALAGSVSRVLSVKELIQFPISLWIANIYQVGQWFLGFITPLPLIFFVIACMRVGKKTKLLIPMVFAVLPLSLSVLLVKSMSARNLVILVPPVLVVASMGTTIFGRLEKAFLTGTALVLFIHASILVVAPLSYYQMLSTYAPAGAGDMSQYTTGWASGYGVKEAIAFIKSDAAGKPSLVFVRVDSGNPEDAVYVLLNREKNFRTLPIIYFPQVQKELQRIKQPINLYFVSRGTQLADMSEKMKELARFVKPLDPEFVGVYRIEL